jgi:hypothetical protein
MLYCGLLLALLVPPATEADAQSSCNAFFAQCSERCVNNPKGESKAKCTRDHCGPKLATCRETGCWREGAKYGGQKACGLK